MRLSRSTRDLLRQVHLWVGLVFGSLFAMVAAAGLPVTYWWASDALFAPNYYAGTIGHHRASFDVLAAAARSAVLTGKLQSVFLLPDYGTAQATLTLPDGASREVSLDIVSARVLGVRSLDDAMISWLYSVHTRLALDRVGFDAAGRIVVMALAAAFLVLFISGLILWWPASWRWNTLAPTLRRRRLWLDLHNKAGIYALAPLAVAAITTLLLEAPPTRGLGSAAAPVMPAAGEATQSPSLEHLAQVGANAAPKLPPLGVFDISDARRIVVATGSEWAGYRWVTVGRQADRALLVSDARPTDLPGPPSASFLIGIHQGHRFGPFGQALFAFAALVPALLFATGFWLWLRRPRRPNNRSTSLIA